jgi:uncharacterized protein YjbI with pentapeptide repeats
MANDEHVALLKQGVGAWNAWRIKNPDVLVPNLRGADLFGADLCGANLTKADLDGASLNGANLTKADLHEASLMKANLTKADLTLANLREAILIEANLTMANLREADLHEASLMKANLTNAFLDGASLNGANLREAKLTEADLEGASLNGANLREANLTGAGLDGASLNGANLREANLTHAFLDGASLSGANLINADLRGANLTNAVLRWADLENAALVDTILRDADLTGCHIYGVSAWNLKLEGTTQQNLVITRRDEPEITVDNIEIAQFIHLLLNNQKVRDVIDTITSKAVLILGRFTVDRKAVLDALREELRKRHYLPILFDFDVPATRDITETVSLLARMARFIIADLTDPSSIPKELEAIVPSLAVPVQPLREGSSKPYAMFKDYWKYDWVLPVYRYEGLEPLLATLAEKVIDPAEGKVKALELRRRMIEAELIKPQ